MAAVLLCAVVAHLPVLTGGFTWLDHGDLEAGAAIAKPSGWGSLFTHGYARTGFYRPITALTLSLDALVGKPWMFHLTSVLLHALASALALLAAEALGLSRRAALLAAILFAVHPVSSSLVTNQIVYRNDSLAAAALFALIAAGSAKRPVLCAIAVVIGALSKETVFVLAPVFVVLLGLSRGERRPAAWMWGAFAGWCVAVVLRFSFAPKWNAKLPPLGVGEAVGTRLASLAKSAWVLVSMDTRICDAFPVTGVLAPFAIAGAVIALSFLALTAWRRGPLMFALFALLPSLAIVAVPRFWSPHYLYLPFAFLAMALFRELDWYGTRVVYAAAPVLIGLAVLSVKDAVRYRSDESLFSYEVEGRPECREAQLYLGDVKRQQSDLGAAAVHYELAAKPTRGILSYSDEAAALQNLGLVRLSQQRFADAENAFNQALAKQGDDRARRELRHNLAVAAMGQGKLEQAISLLRGEASRPDAFPESVKLLARVLVMDHREEEANAVLSDALAKGILNR